jgi:hypothetical protein
VHVQCLGHSWIYVRVIDCELDTGGRVNGRSRSWPMLGKILLAGAISHSWLLIVAVVAITAITYVATIVLVSTLRGGDAEAEFEIKAVLLSVTKRASVGTKDSVQSKTSHKVRRSRR